MTRNELLEHPAIEAFGLAWDFWTTFVWIKTNETSIGKQLLDNVARRRGDGQIARPSDHAAHAISAIHEICCSAETCNQGATGSCSLWQATWNELRHRAATGNIKAVALPVGTNVPINLPQSIWKVAEQPYDPTCVELPTGERWADVRFDAEDVIAGFRLYKKYQGNRPSDEALESVVKGLIASNTNVRDFPKLAKEKFPPDLQPTDAAVHKKRSELGFFRPRGRRKT